MYLDVIREKKEIGYTGIQNRYVASIGKVTVLHNWLGITQWL